MSKRKDLAPVRPKARPYNPKVPKKRFLLCCEGEGTEPGYFTGLAAFLRNPLIDLIEVDIAEHETTDPKKIVEQAKRERAIAQSKAGREHDDNLRYDEVWCVFDRDDHFHFDEAVDQAIANKLNLAASNPCFELWILLHFQAHTGGLTRKVATQKVRQHIPGYEKKVSFSQLKGRTHDAIKRAQDMESYAKEIGKWTDNPTTGVWRLVVNLCQGSDVSITQI